MAETDDARTAAEPTVTETSGTRAAGTAGAAPSAAVPAQPAATTSPVPATTTALAAATTAAAPEPAAAPVRRTSAVRRGWASARARHARMSTTDRIALYAFVVTALAFLFPLAQSAWAALFPERPLALSVRVERSPCTTPWLLTPGNEGLEEGFKTAQDGQYLRWEKEGRILRSGSVVAGVLARGTVDDAVVVRDISITVTGRDAPVPGKAMQSGGCGADDPPEFLVVDLDELPLNRPVSVSYLQNSPTQAAAREARKKLGDPISLPVQVGRDSVYSFFLTGRTLRYDTRWIATVTWWDGKADHTDRIDNGGQPLRATGTAR